MAEHTDSSERNGDGRQEAGAVTRGAVEQSIERAVSRALSTYYYYRHRADETYRRRQEEESSAEESGQEGDPYTDPEGASGGPRPLRP